MASYTTKIHRRQLSRCISVRLAKGNPGSSAAMRPTPAALGNCGSRCRPQAPPKSSPSSPGGPGSAREGPFHDRSGRKWRLAIWVRRGDEDKVRPPHPAMADADFKALAADDE